ncbi:MAG: TssQ family T6SS-associated lipoprotein [Pseudomonadota bacterium]
MKSPTLLACLLGAALLGGCAQNPMSGSYKVDAPAREAPAEAPPPSAARAPAAPQAPLVPAAPLIAAEQALLQEGIALYNNGDYNGAIKRLSAPEIGASGVKAAQLSALKYMAFSYCVTQRQTLCRQQFEKALKLDPAFDLAPGERGHPLWGPVFTRAKKTK